MNNDYNNQQPYYQPNNGGNRPGKGPATASLVCGIISLSISVVLGWTVFACLVGLVLGIVGAVMSVNAKKQGFVGGMQTAGLVLSIIGTILNGIVFAVCLSCTICVTSAAAAGSWGSWY